MIAALIACSGSARAQWSLFPNTHDFGLSDQFYAPRVFGDRVMMVLEARSHPRRLPDSAAKDVNVRGYLLSARITDEKDVKATCQVVGPLYKIDGPMSTVANDAGATFTEADQEALAQKMFLAFREPGVLVKSDVLKSEKSVEDSVLKIEAKTAYWVNAGKRRQLPLLGWHNRDHVESRSHRYAVQKETDGVTRVYDTMTGNEIKDPWLQSVCAEYFSREDLGNSHVFLSDNLNYLVLFLRQANRVTRNGEEAIIEHFAFDGKKLQRANHFLVFARPNERPQLYEDPDLNPFPVVIGDGLLMLKMSDNRLALKNLEKETVITHEFTDKERWISDTIREDNAAEKRIIFITGPGLINGLDRPGKGTLRIAIWDYDHNKLSQYAVPVADLFELKSNGYYPKDAIRIGK